MVATSNLTYLGVAVAVLVGAGSQPLSQGSGEAVLSSPVRDLLALLPPDIELLMAASGPVELERLLDDPDAGLESAVDRFRLFPTGAQLIVTLGEGVVSEFRNLTVLAAVEGSGSFGVPDGEGLMPYAGCHLVRFTGSAEPAFDRLGGLASGRLDVGGYRVLRFGPEGEVLFGLVDPTLLAICTNRSTLDSVLERHRSGESSFLPSAFEGWELVDPESTVWGIRRYSADSAFRDPSSPLAGSPSAGQLKSEGVKGVVVNVKNDFAVPSFILTYRCDDGQSRALVASYWDELLRSLGESSEEVVIATEGRVSVSRRLPEKDFSTVELAVLFALGHGFFI